MTIAQFIAWAWTMGWKFVAFVIKNQGTIWQMILDGKSCDQIINWILTHF